MKRVIMLSIFTALFSIFAKAQSSDVKTLPPIDELGSATFMGHQGGLYPNGSNEMPPAFYQDAIMMAKSIVPLDKNGNADDKGEIGLIALGASTVAMFGKALDKMIEEDNNRRSDINYVNCGIGGQDLSDIMNPSANFWSVIDTRVKEAGMTLDQVQVIWFEEDNLKNRDNDIDARGNALVSDFTQTIQFCKQHYPNLKLFYVSGRHTTAFMPADANDKHREPKAYVNGWACKWLIEKQINGDPALSYKGKNAVAPLILWGPYFWTQGEKPRKDGYSWTTDLVGGDGIHPTAEGEVRVAKDLMDFWTNDPVSQIWFLKNPGKVPTQIEPLQYVNLSINKAVVQQILYSDIADTFRMIILQDSTVVYKNDAMVKKDSILININTSGDYKFLITDTNEKAFAGKFSIDEILNITLEDTKINEKVKGKNAGATIDPDAPAWIVNGANKLPKLKRILTGNDIVRAVFTDAKGKNVAEISDVLHAHTDLNTLLGRGDYTLTFYDENGKVIPLPEEFKSAVRIKY